MNIYIISLESAIDRRNFQIGQLSTLSLDYEFLDATSVNNIDSDTYKIHYFDWQRPLKKTEVACYFSHKNAWEKVIDDDLPALILEDDALLSNRIPEILSILEKKSSSDFVNLENRGRKKFVSKTKERLTNGVNLLGLYQDRTGAAGYILWPSGAKKLIQCEEKKGIALADAHITACNSLNAYQVEPSPIIQLDHCQYYGINNPTELNISKSTVSSTNNPKGNWLFWIRRIHF